MSGPFDLAELEVRTLVGLRNFQRFFRLLIITFVDRVIPTDKEKDRTPSMYSL